MSHGDFTLCVTASALTVRLRRLGTTDIGKVAAAPRGSCCGAWGSPLPAAGPDPAPGLVDKPKLVVRKLGSGNFDAQHQQLISVAD